MCTKAKPGRRDVLNNRSCGPILNSSWLCLPGKRNLSMQPRFQPHHAQFSQDIAACSCLFPNQGQLPCTSGSRGTSGSLQGPEVNMQLRPGTERGAVGLTCVPKAKDTQKQRENFPVSFLTECQLPSATDLPLLLRPGALCFGGLASPPTFL